MEITKEVIYKLGTEFESKTCKMLLVLYGMSNDDGKIDTSLNDLRIRTGLSINTIRGAIKELLEADIIEVFHTVGISTQYSFKHKNNKN